MFYYLIKDKRTILKSFPNIIVDLSDLNYYTGFTRAVKFHEKAISTNSVLFPKQT